ncbi:MAG: winged helix-turn-helix domain-containing protein [Holophagales bacterium]|jgi:hypothetical protein|nr:winged helix-turn-helix domain-containing protein [Holophagales bacterium]
MTVGEEAEFLGGFLKAAGDASVLVAGEIKAVLEARLGRKVHETTVYRMLKRHGWRKVAPGPRHPRQDPKAAEAFKKGVRGGGSEGTGGGEEEESAAEDRVPGRGQDRQDKRPQEMLGAAADAPRRRW